MTTYQENNIRLKDNRYIAKFPWKQEHLKLPSNEMIARKRIHNVINRLDKEPEMLKIYGNIITDQENRDSESPSLNDCLSSTPSQLNKLTDFLTRFRYPNYALTTDIKKAFLQIGLDEKDRDFTRFFWHTDPSNLKSGLETYRIKVILFGMTCSPFILNATLLKHLSTVKSATAEILKRDLYVDNVLTSVNTEEAALNFFEESRELMTNAGFNLRTWKSNSNQLSDLATKANVLHKDSETKILGVRLDAKSDILTFAKLNRY
ncbi:Hypothetical predicted protein [Mytilus galloprovincialis]|uniref:Reverse transcriptase domain-containing protein n=1 Tax=Mytilus galloprovincialis TaxID=29158 RepID=A0A8B6DGF9_MYTGA|nr:Hypothetical predicted protein [Mytilus galloprovincialis]